MTPQDMEAIRAYVQHKPMCQLNCATLMIDGVYTVGSAQEYRVRPRTADDPPPICTCDLDTLLSSLTAAGEGADAVEAFYAKVNARAEADMLSGRPVTGAHHRALEATIAEHRKSQPSPADGKAQEK